MPELTTQMREINSRVDRQKPVIFLGITLLALALLLTGNLTNPAQAGNFKNFSRSYRVQPEGAMLTLAIPAGSIKIKTWERAEIKVGGSLLEESLAVTEKQINNSVEIEVHCSKAGQSHFDIFVPINCTLDLKCLNGTIEVSSANGRILAQTAEGSITLSELHSTNITAKSISGQISYRGVLDPKGIYNFHSVENTVDITVPANSAFTLMATAIAGKIELGGFQLSETVPQEKRVAGKHGGGGASLNLSTHRGQIRLHKTP